MPPRLWPELPPDPRRFADPPRAYGILPFWFLNGALDPDEMRWQLREFHDKGMPGIILHGRYGLETPYLGDIYLQRITFAVEEAARLGLQTWIYDEMNWPSGTADGRVLQERPDLAQRYIECISFPVRGPWFTYLTGADSRYLDFERSTPIAAFAIDSDGRVLDLTPNLSFVNVIPWEAPPGNWRVMYVVEKRADYYIDALDPEATREFLRIGYEPYARAIGSRLSGEMPGFYTDEPAMHYYVTGGDNPIVPWTRDMFRRFQERNGYNLRPRLPDLFFDVGPDSARVRHDFYTTLTDFYSDAYYRQIHQWCREHNVLFTGHLLYEEWLRKMIRVEGNLFKHYAHMDIIGVDHLYPFIGNRDRPDEHVAIKVASSAAHQLGSQRLLCESFGGIFMDATMQRMKWIADWEYVLGVTLLNPHGFHYTLEGPRKRDWPPSMFYQYPWWRYYGAFSTYISRLSELLTGGRHVAKVAVLWPINALFGTYTPQSHNPLGDRTEGDFNVLTDLLLRLHYDFDYLDEDMLAGATAADSHPLLPGVEGEAPLPGAAQTDGHDPLPAASVRIGDEAYELVILPPMAHLKLSTLDRLEGFVARGGRVLGTIVLPDRAYGPDGLVDVSARIAALFGVDPTETQQSFHHQTGLEMVGREHPGGGKTAFLRGYALARQLPLRLQQRLGTPGRTENAAFVIEPAGDSNRYWYAPADGEREEITAEVMAERREVAAAVRQALRGLIAPDVTIDNEEVFYLHRVKDEQDIYFLVNPTFTAQTATVTLTGAVQPLLWDPSTGAAQPIAPSQEVDGRTRFTLTLPPTGSSFICPASADGGARPSPHARPDYTQPASPARPDYTQSASPKLPDKTQTASPPRIVDTNIVVDAIDDDHVAGYARAGDGYLIVEQDGQQRRLEARTGEPAQTLALDGDWEFSADDANALVIGRWLATTGVAGTPHEVYAAPGAATAGWLPMAPGAWSYQLPAEPAEPYPIDVWYRIPFWAVYVPADTHVVVDGFAGSEWDLYVNGRPVTATPLRSAIDGQMLAVDIANLVRAGDNVVALRLRVTSATDGLLDLLKITGDFSLARRDDGGDAAGYAIAPPRRRVQAASWTTQGYPFFSGQGVYRRSFELPDDCRGQRIFLEPEMIDDVLEVVVNGRPAGVRLWPPYGVDITGLLRPGENTIALRVANTLVNLLEAVERPSGLAGPPRLVPYQSFTFGLAATDAAPVAGAGHGA